MTNIRSVTQVTSSFQNQGAELRPAAVPRAVMSAVGGWVPITMPGGGAPPIRNAKNYTPGRSPGPALSHAVCGGFGRPGTSAHTAGNSRLERNCGVKITVLSLTCKILI